jgi:hypothetical protein
MAEVSQYSVNPRELIELILKSAGIREGRWFLNANFGIAPGNFGLTATQVTPGVVVVIQNIGVSREMPGANLPPDSVVDAAKIEYAQSEQNGAPKKPGRAKAST